MEARRIIVGVLTFGLLISWRVKSAESLAPTSQGEATARTFMARGVVKELEADGRTVLVKHEAISNYMAAMTMPFKVKEAKELVGLRAGDEIAFQLRVTETESWIERIAKIGTVPLEKNNQPANEPAAEAQTARARHPLMDYQFTNELGQAMSLGEFRGQALAITFFFTRCPIPDYCPRLSKNFQEAARKLSSMPGGPTNWHFLSVSFDTEFDAPTVLKAYGERYQYDPKRWNFLTGPADKIAELARLSGVTIDRASSLFNHNFRTLIIDAAGHLQTTFPMGGDLSDAIVEEIRRAAAVTNISALRNPNHGHSQSAPAVISGRPPDPVAY